MRHRYKTDAGFTLLEIITVTFIISIISAIAVPSWLGFIHHQKLQASIHRLNWAVKAAQGRAKLDNTAWQTSIREQDGRVQVAIHEADTPPGKLPETLWENLESGIEIDNKDKNDKGKLETTLRKVNPDTNEVKNAGTVYRVLFNYKGCPVYKPSDTCTQTSLQAKGRIALIHPQMGDKKRCLIVSTLLGATRLGEDQDKAKDGYYCY